MLQKTCIILVGPTAVGKTSLGIELALDLETEIISADSRQCYKELNIGVAKPTLDQLRTVRHHFINSHSIHEEVNAAVFEQYSLDAIAKIFMHSDYALIVGGTGLYIKAFTEGMDAIPEIPVVVRALIVHEYEEKGLQWLQETIRSQDPEFYTAGEMQNPQRMMRALEVKRFTGNSVLSFRSSKKITRDFRIIKLGMKLPREKLYANINRRVDEMMARGLLEEVAALQPFQHRNALQTVGYKEIFPYFNNHKPLATAVEEIKMHTRHYAKRQMTWFSKDKEIHWIENLTISDASSFIKNAT